MPLKDRGLLLEKFYLKIREKKGIYRALLKTLTFCFKGAVKIRNRLYDSGIKKGKKAPLPIISVGNVAVGGTGKTPFTIFLAKALQNYCRVAIISRGYRSLAEKRVKPLVVSEGEGASPLFPPDIVGDEAYLMAINLPHAIIISAKNRFLGAIEAKKRGADLVILDDGMQHRNLSRDVDIALISGDECEDDFLPVGYLRDDPKRLSHADFLISRGKDFLGAITISDRTVGVVSRDGKIRESLTGVAVFAFCGIAKPDTFFKAVEECGAYIVGSLTLADHEKASIEQLHTICEEAQAKGASILLTTEKDFVKYEDTLLPLPLFWIKREMYIAANFQRWNALIQRIRGLVV